ncbi:MAG: hypothetical protein J5750_09295 [Clostridiales bacterium]|nr:hypothetical protein [Clostridiales bacterium]
MRGLFRNRVSVALALLLCAGLLYGCGSKNEESDSSSSLQSTVNVTSPGTDSSGGDPAGSSSGATESSIEVKTIADVTSETGTVPSDTTSEAISSETPSETSEESTPPTEEESRTLSEEERMSQLRDEEEDYDPEEDNGDSNGNGTNNGGNGGSNNGSGNGGTTTTQPTYATEPTAGTPGVDKPQGHWETRVISEAWDETVVDQEAWDEEVKVAVGSVSTQNDTGTDMTGWSGAQKIAWCESHNCPNHCDDYDPSQPGYCACNVTIKTVYETQIVHHDAVTHVVHHDAVTEQVWVED